MISSIWIRTRGRRVLSLLLLTALLVPVGCRPKKPPTPQPLNFTQPLPPGQVALRKLSPGEYPDFSRMDTDLPALRQAIERSLEYLARPSSQQHFPYLDITHDRAVATLLELRQMIESSPPGSIDWNREIPRRFDVYKSVGAPRPEDGGPSGRVLFTGYFTPIYPASLTRTGPYVYPLYRRPADLPPASDRGELERPYLTRAQIESIPSPLAGNELVWLSSRWHAYLITVQGSARLRLTDGRIYEIGYAGHNGHDYVSPGRQMVADGVIPPDQLTLKGLETYFAARPQEMDRYLNLNPRYVFFTERPGGPFGSLNVPVTAFATIATDKAVYPRAMPAFLVVPIPDGQGGTRPFRGIMLDQDTGGAIRAAGRCDIFMGIGDQAERLAGRQLHEGELYYLAVREVPGAP